MANRRIFVACGQETDEEKKLGTAILNVIAEHGMDGFFAETVHSADELNTAVFKAIDEAHGFCAVMHRRGEINYRHYPPTQRSSVWIQQEIAILMYRRFLTGRPLPIRVYCEKGILLEGIMKTSIINPIQFEEVDEVVKGVSEWLTGPAFEEHPVVGLRERLFQKRVEKLEQFDFLLLRLIAAHTTPGVGADQGAVIVDFVDILKEAGKDGREIQNIKSGSIDRLMGNFLIDQQSDRRSGGTIISIQPKWWDLVLSELRTKGHMG